MATISPGKHDEAPTPSSCFLDRAKQKKIVMRAGKTDICDKAFSLMWAAWDALEAHGTVEKARAIKVELAWDPRLEVHRLHVRARTAAELVKDQVVLAKKYAREEAAHAESRVQNDAGPAFRSFCDDFIADGDLAECAPAEQSMSQASTQRACNAGNLPASAGSVASAVPAMPMPATLPYPQALTLGLPAQPSPPAQPSLRPAAQVDLDDSVYADTIPDDSAYADTIPDYHEQHEPHQAPPTEVESSASPSPGRRSVTPSVFVSLTHEGGRRSRSRSS